MKAFWRHHISPLLLLTIFAWTLAACGSNSTPATTTASSPSACGSENSTTTNTTATTSKTGITVKIGYFPNITHAVALVGLSCGTFAHNLAPNTIAETRFNAGGDFITALLAGSIDIGYVGPSPAVNGYIKSNGSALRIIAGASSGGVRFIVQPDENIKKASDLSGKKIADPQAGATQDIALRHYLQQNHLDATDKGGTVEVISTDNSSIVNEFKLHQIDGAWVPEPYASRLIVEGKGKVFLDERDLWPGKKFVTTNIVVRTDFLKQHPDVVKEFLQADVETVQHINANLPDAKNRANQELASFPGGKKLAQQTIDSAFDNLSITYDPLASSLFTGADNAYALGALKKKPDAGIYDLDPLNSVLTSKGLSKVSLS
jgi:NitT/TauT family transport system substrate-binding protein